MSNSASLPPPPPSPGAQRQRRIIVLSEEFMRDQTKPSFFFFFSLPASYRLLTLILSDTFKEPGACQAESAMKLTDTCKSWIVGRIKYRQRSIGGIFSGGFILPREKCEPCVKPPGSLGTHRLSSMGVASGLRCNANTAVWFS